MGATAKDATEDGHAVTHFKGTLYHNKVAAHFASFLELAHISFVYRKHFFRVVQGGGCGFEHLGDFWLPESNTFVTLFPTMPCRRTCLRAERAAAMGHNVVVLVGECSPPVADTDGKHAGTGWRGWRIPAFGKSVEAGHAMWLEGADVPELAVTACPYDERACTPVMEELYMSAVAAVVSLDSDVDTEPDQ